MARKTTKFNDYKSLLILALLVLGTIIGTVSINSFQTRRAISAGENATVLLTPSNASLKSGSEQNINLSISPSGYPVAFAHIEVTFEKASLEVISIQKGTTLNRLVSMTSTVDANNTGKIIFVLAADPGITLPSNAFEIGNIKVRPRTTQTKNVSVSVNISTSQVVGQSAQTFSLKGNTTVLALNPASPTPVPTATTSTITHNQTVAGRTTTEGATSVTSATIDGGSNRLYVASVSTKPNREVTNVSGLGLSWQRAGAQCAGRSAARTEVWYAQGSPTSAGSVTADVESGDNFKGLAIAVSSFSGANPQSPVGNIVTKNSRGVADTRCDGGDDSDSYSLSLSTTAGNLIYSAVSIRHYSHTPGSGFAELTEAHTSIGGGDDAGLGVMTKTASGGVNTVNGRTSNDVDYAVVALEIKE